MKLLQIAMQLIVTIMALLIFWGCGQDNSPIVGVGPAGPQGPAGANGQNGSQGPQGVAGATGATGAQGVAGATGVAGTNGTTITPVQLCQACQSVYPTTFPESALCINNRLYGVYSVNDGFLALLPDGAYSSDGINCSCNFTIKGCTITGN